MEKTNITPLIDQLDVLEVSDLKILLVMYHFGGYLEPKELETYTGLHLRTVKDSLKRPRVKNLIKRIEEKDELEVWKLQHMKMLSHITRKKIEAELQNK